MLRKQDIAPRQKAAPAPEKAPAAPAVAAPDPALRQMLAAIAGMADSIATLPERIAAAQPLPQPPAARQVDLRIERDNKGKMTRVVGTII